MKSTALALGVAGAALLLFVEKGTKKMSQTPGVEFPKSSLPIDPRPTREDVVLYDAIDRVHAPRPGVESFRGFVLGLLGGQDLGIWSSLQHQQQNSHSEHDVGRAWDWGFKNVDDAQTLINWLHANDDEWARRFGIGYLLFQRRELREYAPIGWADYHGQDPHTTHVHFSFSKDGAFGRTSGYDFYQDNRAMV